MGGRGGTSGRGGNSHIAFGGGAGGGGGPGGNQNSNLPLTLRNFAQKEAADAQRIIQSAGFSAADVKYLEGQLARVIAENDPAMRVKADVVELILDSYFKNQFETNTSEGAFDPKTRARTSAAYFGHSYDKPGAIAADEFEKYGYLASRDKLLDLTEFSNAEMYGDVVFRFKRDAIMHRTTFKTGDTLGTFRNAESAHASWLNAPSIAGISDNYYSDWSTALYGVHAAEADIKNPTKWVHRVNGGLYFELQYHGHLSLDDVESITFSDTLKLRPNFDAVLKKLKKKGIRAYYVNGGTVNEL